MSPTSTPDTSLAQELSRLVQQAFAELLQRSAADDAAPLRVKPAARPTAPARLASAHPGGTKARQEAQALYQRCLRHYRSAVQPVVAPQAGDDVAMAAAYFVLANLAALQPQLQPDERQLGHVARQMRLLIGGSDAWRRADEPARQLLFEQFATLGVLVNESRLKAAVEGPAARDHLQRAARGYLQQILGLDPDLLVVGPEGLGTPDTLH